MEILKRGGDTLEAAVAAVTIVEDDPNDDSVGYGGLPNEEGVVELDASVMHGSTRRAGSVASVQKIKNVARLAKTSFNWRPGIDSPEWKEYMTQLFDGDADAIAYAEERIAHPITGTIKCLAVDAKGEVSGTTTTSGLSWKIPGRVGDSPIVGAGLYVDGDVGGAGSTGKGEEHIKISGGHTIVEMMRKGMKPTDACLEALGARGAELQRG